MKKRYYLAYGSNLNLEQMKRRCPTAVKVGTAIIENYRLMFKGSGSGNYLTVEKANGHYVPVGVFIIQPRDEHSLDIYEGYPNFYYKKEIKVVLKDSEGDDTPIEAFAYIMHEKFTLGEPSQRYVNTVLEGYKTFGFDKSLIEEAIRYSSK